MTRSPRSINSRKGGATAKMPGCSINVVFLALVLMAFVFTGSTFLTFHASTSYQQSRDEAQIRLANQNDVPSDNIHYAASSQAQQSNDNDAASIADLVTWMLLGKTSDKDYYTPDNALKRYRHDSPSSQTSLQFAPGTLHLSHEQTLRHCHADPSIYRRHLEKRGSGKSVRVSYSDPHKLAYVMLPKSGSSTARFMLQHEFDAKEVNKPLVDAAFAPGGPMEGVHVLTFVRDPLSRFLSQYDEAFVRTAPWQSSQNPFRKDADGNYPDRPHPFPFLHEHLHSYRDYENVFCPPETRVPPQSDRKQCLFAPTRENGTLAARFERFVREYDGLDPFDVHLTLQVPLLSGMDGTPLHLTKIYNTSDSEGGWNEIARQFLGKSADDRDGERNGNNDGSGGELLGKAKEKATKNTKVKGGVIEGRSYPRRFDSKLVSVETQRRICRLALLDYCCLNLPLPEVCRGKHHEAGDGLSELFCVLDKKGKIQPGMFPNGVG
mmetsp:Transcript_10546/g.22056  ORF Transcript_10546/g.22056 Transcript_10546/m.22056 type:complete len:492 (-) Transcript_10546:177-1652(-)